MLRLCCLAALRRQGALDHDVGRLLGLQLLQLSDECAVSSVISRLTSFARGSFALCTTCRPLWRRYTARVQHLSRKLRRPDTWSASCYATSAWSRAARSTPWARIELERIKDEVVLTVFKADGCPYLRGDHGSSSTPSGGHFAVMSFVDPSARQSHAHLEPARHADGTITEGGGPGWQ
jgi:hypothetical protein